jgi:hypothetical protein
LVFSLNSTAFLQAGPMIYQQQQNGNSQMIRDNLFHGKHRT